MPGKSSKPKLKPNSKIRVEIQKCIKDLNLKAMVKLVTKQNRHKLINDKPCGREVW